METKQHYLTETDNQARRTWLCIALCVGGVYLTGAGLVIWALCEVMK